MSELPFKPKRKKTGGRKKMVPPVKQRHVMLTDDQVKLLRVLGRGDISAGLRWLITNAAPLIQKQSQMEYQQGDLVDLRRSNK